MSEMETRNRELRKLFSEMQESIVDMAKYVASQPDIEEELDISDLDNLEFVKKIFVFAEQDTTLLERAIQKRKGLPNKEEEEEKKWAVTVRMYRWARVITLILVAFEVVEIFFFTRKMWRHYF